MTNRPVSVTVTFAFILLNILVWLAFGIIVAINAHPNLPDIPIMKVIMTILSFAVAGIMVGLFILLRKPNQVAYFLILAVLGVISLLTFFDDVGWIDLLFLAINIVPVILLIKDRTWYLEPSKSNQLKSV